MRRWWWCKVRRLHAWDRDVLAINPATHLFARVNCTRCGEAIDGAALRRLADCDMPRVAREARRLAEGHA